MIKSIQLTNFRQHRNLSLDFASGVTIVRGFNEKGKTTILEAINYALNGIRSCRNNDITTWGEDEKSTKVSLTLEIDGQPCKIYRTKSSAELVYGDRRVTGQSDVSAAIEQLLGLRPGSGNKLMFASQQDIRGILNEGSAATLALIEELADLSLMDKIIDAFQGNSMTGSSSVLDGLLANAKHSLDNLGEREDVDEDAFLSRIELVGHQLEMVKHRVEDLTEQEVSLKAARNKAVEVSEQRAALKSDIESLTKSVEEDLTLIKNLKKVESVNQKELDDAESAVQNADRSNQVYALYASWTAESQPETFYAAKEVLETEMTGLRELLGEHSRQKYNLTRDLEHLKKTLDDTGLCPECGQDLTHIPDYVERQEKARTSYTEKSHKLDAVEASILKHTKRLDDLVEILKLPSLVRYADRNPELFTVDDSVWPIRLEWNGKTPEAVDASALKVEAKRLRDAMVEYQAAQKNIQVAENRIVKHKADVEAAQEALKIFKEVDVREANAAWERANTVLLDALEEQRALQANERNVRAERDTALREYKDWRQRKEAAEKQVKDVEESLQKLQFNNTLLRRLRQIKPEITNKVWSTVLSVVSNYFTKMRGAPSTVSKSSTGFLVDGKPFESYSGSAIDVLGLAIRVALIKTFAPSCKMLLLDEPFSACAEERQKASMAFLLSAGFEQVLLVTHEDTSEIVADNLIEL